MQLAFVKKHTNAVDQMLLLFGPKHKHELLDHLFDGKMGQWQFWQTE